MKITKAQFGVEGDRLSLHVPLSKVNKQKRIVSGFATIDSVDTQGDVVTAEASAKAFANFRGNIRLMHQPIPAGKMISFQEEDFYDQEDEKFYRGIFVNVYVSEGAEDIWKMVLDGTLTGFSIGGNITESENEFVKDASGGRNVRFVKGYDLVELSLVDSPANQLSNIVSVTKSATGETVLDGMAPSIEVNNVFYCKEDDRAVSSAEVSKDCAICDNAMVNIGWFENVEGKTDKAAKVSNLIKSFTADVEKVITSGQARGKKVESGEGGVDMTDEKKELEHGEHPEEGVTVDNASDENVITEETEESKVTEDGAVDETAKAAEVDEVTTSEPDFEKMLTEVREAITANSDETKKSLEALEAKIEKASEDFTKSFESLKQEHTTLSEKFSSLNSGFESVEKRIEAVEDGTAVKKSGDLGGDRKESLKKSDSPWGGKFFSVNSVD